MNRQAAAGFLLTVGVLVPAAWHSVGADIERDGKHMRPMQQTMTVGDVKVLLDVDRSVVMTGDTVTAKLVAVSDKPQDITVDLRALHTTNYSGERVERPWQQLDREAITLHAAPGGGKPVTTRIKLGDAPAEAALEDSFKILVTKHGVVPTKRTYDMQGEDKHPDYDTLGTAEDGSDVAGIFIRGWSGNSLGMKIAPEGPITADHEFTIDVKIKNTSGHKLESPPWVNLTTEDALSATGDDSVPLLEINRVDSDDSDPKPVRRNGEYVQKFVVIPHGKLPATISFLADANENEGLGPHGAGAMDIATFKVVPSTVAPKVAVE
jgi:hypothetical protein